MIFDEKYIQSRVDRSKETLDEAKLLFNEEHYLTVINRLYYAMFYLACAYLGKANIITKTHSGTKNQFYDNFIKNEMLSNDFGKLYSKLFKDRNDNDYGDFAVLNKEDVQELLNETEEQLNKYWIEFEKYNQG